MRRALLAVLMGVVSVGAAGLPALADNGGNGGSKVTLSYDFSDNDARAAVSNGAFNIISDVLPEHTGGLVRMLAIAPDGVNDPTMVCDFQSVQQSQVECSFKFPDPGLWTIKSQYEVAPKADISAVSVIRLRVAN